MREPTLLAGDAIAMMQTLADKSVNCVITSPPYFGLRDYGVAGQIGLEPTPDAYVAQIVQVFREVRRVLKDDGTVWLNLGDAYVASACGVKVGGVSQASGLNGISSAAYRATLEAGHGQTVDKTAFGLPVKNLIGIPWRVAFALQADGWYLRSDIIWHKPNPMPESVTDRPTKAHEYLFLLSKSERYYYDADAIRERNTPDMQRRAAAGHTRGAHGKLDASRRDASTLRGSDAMAIESNGRNKRTVWTVPTQPYRGAHFATMPELLIEPCVLAGCPLGGVVLDPLCGSGTVGVVALHHGREFIGIDLNGEYIKLAVARIAAGPKRLGKEKKK